VFFGEVTHEKNREISDIDAREKWSLVVVSVVILWMGISSPFFTRRIAADCKAVVDAVNPNVAREAAAPGKVKIEFHLAQVPAGEAGDSHTEANVERVAAH
jgi:hypothetical protein